MKTKFLSVISTVIAMLMTCTVFLAGCFGSGNNTPEDTTPKEYTIQYTDDSGTHQITVTAGMPYALDVVPEKTGYTFTGLFDAEVGGTQYVSASGASLSAFTDGKNMVLFPQFKAKLYLDFRLSGRNCHGQQTAYRGLRFELARIAQKLNERT